MVKAGFLTICLAVFALPAQAACRDERADLRGPWGVAQFSVELAETEKARSRGLMHRPSLPSGSGMLFLYETPQRVVFWMENTLIPLDMIFMSADGVVRRIHENAVPLDKTHIPGGENVQAVLEINGGLASKLGITVGSVLRHPRLDQSLAAWPCNGG